MSTASYNTGHNMYDMTDAQFQLVYNVLSFTFASMIASTIFYWMRVGDIAQKYRSALVITGLVTFIAAYHYLRIFNSWVASYQYPAIGGQNKSTVGNPQLTGIPFNDAYRYMDWLLTVPLLLIEIVLVMNLGEDETFKKSWQLGAAAALMIILGYPGELILAEDKLGGRWVYWTLAMIPFLFVVYTLLVGLAGATNSEPDEGVRSSIRTAQWMTVLSWCTYPIVYIIPMFGAKGANAVVGIQIGYCISDIIAKCGVGFLIYNITARKSAKLSTNDGYNPVQ